MGLKREMIRPDISGKIPGPTLEIPEKPDR
jgi:hypothetical protein